MSEALKPCPFCRGTKINLYFSACENAHMVCMSCEASGPEIDFKECDRRKYWDDPAWHDDYSAIMKRDARQAWNTRAEVKGDE